MGVSDVSEDGSMSEQNSEPKTRLNKVTRRPTWVIQTNQIKTSQVLPLVEALRALGEPFVDVGVDFETGLMSPVEGKNLIPYGSTHLVKIAQREGWRHLYFDEARFNVSAWNAHHPKMLNPDAEVMTLTETKAIAGKRPEWFIRPIDDLKAFSGHVLASDALVDWVTRLEVGDCEISGSCLVAVSSPKAIQMEWRYFVVGGRIVTGSSYQLLGRSEAHRETDPAVIAEAQTLADLWLPHACCCMDVALHDDQARVVEFNVINASGFYDHDITAFAKALSDYANDRG